MSDRDLDLDKIFAEADKKGPALQIADGTMCWLDADRQCGPDCTAFNAHGVGVPKDELVQGAMQCTVLALLAKSADTSAALVISSRKRVQQVQDARREQELRDARDGVKGTPR